MVVRGETFQITFKNLIKFHKKTNKNEPNI